MSDRASPVHVGVFHDSPADLGRAVAGCVRRALADGRPVVASLDDDLVAALRAAVGPASERIRLLPRTPPVPGPAPGWFLGRLRSWDAARDPVLVVRQHGAPPDDPPDPADTEDGINLLLGDGPMTVVCACPRSADPERRAAARRAHPSWLDAGVLSRNPEYRPPPDRCPTAATQWGRVVWRTTFRGIADLTRIRHQVIEIVSEIGMRGADADAAVLAVHEAAALTCRAGRDTGVPVEPDARVRTVEVRTTGTSLFSEVRAPGPSGPGRSAEMHTVAGATVCDADELRDLTWFCHRAAIHERGGSHTVRVLVDRAHPLADRRPPG